MNHPVETTHTNEPNLGYTDLQGVLGNIVNSIADPVFVKDEQHRWVLLNDALCQFIGYTRQQLLGKSDHEFFPKDQADIFWEKDSQVLQTGEENVNEESFTDGYGILHTVVTKKNLYRDNSGKKYIVGVIRDVTAQKKAEREIHRLNEALEQRFLSTFEQAAVGIAHVGLNGEWIRLNRKYCDILGYSHDELIGKTFQDLTAPEDLAANLEQHRRMITGEIDNYSLEKRYICKDGKIVWVNLTASVARSADGEAQYTIAVIEEISSRKLMETELKERRERYLAVLEGSDDGVWDWNLLTNELYWNNRYFEMLGLTRDSFIPTPTTLETLMHPDELQNSLAVIERCFRENSPFQLEYRMRHASGEYIYCLCRGKIFNDAQGKPVRFAGTVTDLTYQKRAEQALAESEERFRSMADYSPMMIGVSDALGQATYFSRAWLEYTGATLNDMLRLGWADYVHPDDRQHFLQSFLDAYARHESFSVEFRLRRYDGEYRWIMGFAAARLTPDGDYAGYIGCNIDITDRKLAEEKVTQALQRERLVRRIIEAVNDSPDIHSFLEFTAGEVCHYFQADRCFIFTYDRSVTPIQLAMPIQNVCSQDVSRVDIKDIPFPAIHSYIQQQSSTSDTDILLNISSQQSDIPGEIQTYARKYGIQAILVLEIIYRGIHYGRFCLHQCSRDGLWQADDIDLLRIILTHIGTAMYQVELYEQEQQARVEAQSANQRKSQFLANMSHELRTPLNAIIGYSEMLYGGIGGPLSNKQSKYALNVTQSGKHLLKLVNEILDLAKVEAGKISLHCEIIDPHTTLQEVYQMMAESALQKNLQLTFSIPPELKEVQADPGRLRQILINLVSNAVKFNKEGGKISINLEFTPDKHWIQFTVADTGIGISKANLQEMFTEFYQVDNTFARAHEGTGLGLALTRHLVELHGGTISVKSEIDVGSQFTFTLPVQSLSPVA